MNNSWARFLYPSQNIYVVRLFRNFIEATKRSPMDGMYDGARDLFLLSVTAISNNLSQCRGYH
jgi:hypothetical protein